MELDMTKFVKMQAEKVVEQFSLIDYTKVVLRLPEPMAMKILSNLQEEYANFVVRYSEQKVEEFTKMAMKKVLGEEIIDYVEDLDELEEVTDEEFDEIEPVPEDDDLEYVIRCQIRQKNIRIEREMGKYPEESTENYWMIGIDINEIPEEELQSLSIFDRDFW